MGNAKIAGQPASQPAANAPPTKKRTLNLCWPIREGGGYDVDDDEADAVDSDAVCVSGSFT